MRIIAFGDSFARLNKNGSKEDWIHYLGKLLNVDDVISYGYQGTSLQWSIEKFYEYYTTDYRPDDYIIFLASHSSRLYYLYPGATDSWHSCHDEILSRTYTADDKEKHFEKHIDGYRFLTDHIMNDDRAKCQYFLIKQTLQSLPNKHILIDCFPDIYNPNGSFNLYDISYNEFKDQSISKMISDKRVCHFSRENHITMADKVFYYFTMGIELNSKGFRKHLLD